MRLNVPVLLTLSAVLVASQVAALEQPMIAAPSEGAMLGPNYDVMGSMPYKAFLVVMTDVINSETDEVIASVPGIRHWTEDDGSFHFRVAAPRISFGEKEIAPKYRVRVYEARWGEMGEETIIDAGSMRQSMAETMAVVPTSVAEDGHIMVTIPREGDALGPNYEVVGRAPGRMLLVVMTDAINAQTGEVLRTVPGIRHWTKADGSFRFRVAAPRVAIGDRDTDLTYRVRVFEGSRGATGPETIIDVSMAQ